MISIALGIGLAAINGSQASEAPPTYATIETASLKFPTYNRITNGPGIAWLKQTTTNFPSFFISTGTTVADGMFYAKFKLPFGRLAGFYQTRILGSGGVSGSRFLLSYYSPRHSTSARRNRIVFEGGPNAAGITAGLTAFALISADVPRDCTAGFMAIARRVGTTVRLDLMRLDTGELLPGTAVVNSTAAQNAHQPIYIGDSDSVDPATTFAYSVATHAFDGEISEVGYYSGTVTDENAGAIANGSPIESVLTPASVKYLRRLVDAGATSRAPVAGLGDTTSSLTASGTFRLGSTIGRQGADYLTLTSTTREGTVWPFMRGASTAEVSLSGRAAGVTTVQARVLALDDGEVVKDWTDVATVSGGAWSGTLNVPKDAGEIVIDLRDKDDQALVFHDRTRQAIGVRVLLVGQSPLQIMFDSVVRTQAYSGSAFASLSRFEAGQVANKPETHILCGITRSDGIHALANEFSRRTGYPIQIVSGAVSGTTNYSLVYDAITSRSWDDLVEMLDFTGRRMSVIYHNWGNSDAAQGSKFGEAVLDPVLYGAQPDLAANLTIGVTTYGVGNPPPAPDHYLTDGDIEGAFKIVVTPVTRATDALAANYDATRRETLDYIAAHAAIIKGPNIDLMRTGGASGASAASPHPDETVAMGNEYLGAYHAEGIMRAMALSNLVDPTIASVQFTDATKAVIRVSVTLPSGGALKTRDNATWSANVQGFEVSDNAGSSWSRTGFTGAIVGNTVELTKTTGAWTGGGSTMVRYLYGDPIDTADATEEGTSPSQGALFASTPQVWRDAAGADLGLSVQRMEAAAVAAS